MSRPTDTNNNPLSLDMIDEDRVRRALGLKSSSSSTPHQQRPEQARQRHRFATDGSVPVVMLNRSDNDSSGLKDRLSAATHALESERTAHTATKRLLQEAQQARQALQTRLGHDELSHSELLRTERDARREAEEALANFKLEVERAEIERVETARVEAARVEDERRAAPPVVAQPVRQRREIRASEPIPRQKRPANEPKPVRWWTPSYRAKQQ